MKFKSLQQPSWLVIPAVSMTMVYGGIIACWFVYLSCTMMHPSIFQQGPFYLISTGNYWVFTAANVGLAAWLLISLSSVKRAPRANRRGSLGGVAVSLTFVAALQMGAEALHTDLNSENRMAPEVIANVISNNSGDGQDAVEYLRNALHATYPGLEEAVSRESLHFRYEGDISHSLALSPSLLRLDFYGCSAPLPSAGDAPWSFARPSDNRLSMSIPLPLSKSHLERLRHTAQGLPRVDGFGL